MPRYLVTPGGMILGRFSNPPRKTASIMGLGTPVGCRRGPRSGCGLPVRRGLSATPIFAWRFFSSWDIVQEALPHRRCTGRGNNCQLRDSNTRKAVRARHGTRNGSLSHASFEIRRSHESSIWAALGRMKPWELFLSYSATSQRHCRSFRRASKSHFSLSTCSTAGAQRLLAKCTR